jgi:hypothetical protein
MYCVRFKKVQLGSITLLFSSFLFIISKFYISTLIVKIQLNDNKFKNINLLFTTQYKLFIYQVMSCHIHDCYSVIVVEFLLRKIIWSMQDDDSLLRSFVTNKPAAEKILSDGTDVD